MSEVAIHPTRSDSPEQALEDAARILEGLREDGKPCYAVVLIGPDDTLPAMCWSAIKLRDLAVCEARIALQVNVRMHSAYDKEPL